MATAKILPEHIATEQQVIHPALDWRENTLLMGLKLDNGERGVLTSTGQIILVEELPWPSCDRGRHFDRSPVTTNVAQRFQAGYGTPSDSQNPYALVNVPGLLSAYY